SRFADFFISPTPMDAEGSGKSAAFGTIPRASQIAPLGKKSTMNILDVIQQTTQRAGKHNTRQRNTEMFKRRTKNWRAVEKLERVICRLEQLGMHQVASKLASNVASGAPLAGFNPLERIIGQSQLMSSFFL